MSVCVCVCVHARTVSFIKHTCPKSSRQQERAAFCGRGFNGFPPGHKPESVSPESFLVAATGAQESEDEAALRLSLQTDLCLPNGLRQWSGKNTIERDQREREADGEKRTN